MNRTKIVNIFYQIIDNIPRIVPKNETCSRTVLRERIAVLQICSDNVSNNVCFKT